MHRPLSDFDRALYRPLWYRDSRVFDRHLSFQDRVCIDLYQKPGGASIDPYPGRIRSYPSQGTTSWIDPYPGRIGGDPGTAFC